MAQANKDRETLFQRCVELTAQVQGNEDKLKRAADAEQQVVELKSKLAEAEKGTQRGIFHFFFHIYFYPNLGHWS